MGTKKPNRRQFLVAGSSAAFIAAVPPIPSGAESRSQADALVESADRESSPTRPPNSLSTGRSALSAATKQPR